MATYTRDSSKDITQTTVIDNHDANTLYNIIDDTDTTIPLLELLFPVGSIYIGTMSACPLQTLGVGTWQLVATDRVLQGAGTRGSVGDTLNESLPNITGGNLFYENGCKDFWGAIYNSGTGIGSRGGTDSDNPVGRFDASRSSSTYQDNAPVQQDAYLVNIWERVA